MGSEQESVGRRCDGIVKRFEIHEAGRCNVKGLVEV